MDAPDRGISQEAVKMKGVLQAKSGFSHKGIHPWNMGSKESMG
jgi:hypothetical protein